MSAAAARFVRRFPFLFHVTRVSAVEGIRQSGLLPAARLGAGGDNRGAWTEVAGAAAWLRWQRLSDTVLRTRLPPHISPADWRGFINGMAFLFPTVREAQALMAAPADRGVAQTILRFRTEDVLAQHDDLRVCRWNNGFADRSRPPRIKRYEDYVPATAWTGGPIREVVAPGGVSAAVGFEVVA